MLRPLLIHHNTFAWNLFFPLHLILKYNRFEPCLFKQNTKAGFITILFLLYLTLIPQFQQQEGPSQNQQQESKEPIPEGAVSKPTTGINRTNSMIMPFKINESTEPISLIIPS